jgi:hypothetical protein
MDLKYCLPQSILTLIILQLGLMRICNPLDLSLKDVFYNNQYIHVYNFFQDSLGFFITYMVLAFFRNEVIRILYQQIII